VVPIEVQIEARAAAEIVVAGRAVAVADVVLDVAGLAVEAAVEGTRIFGGSVSCRVLKRCCR
jgi:hypothetical protein